VLIRADSGGGTHEFLAWLARPGCRLHYSVGMTITDDIQDAILKIPDAAWTPACDGEGQARDGAWVAEITGMLDLSCWPAGMRVIVRKERPHPARSCGSPASTGTGSPASPPAPRAVSSLIWNCGTAAGPGARTGSGIPNHTGLRNLPLHGYAQNQIWCEIVALACELLAWTQMLAFDGPARRWEPKRLRLRVFAVAGRLVRGGRRLRLRLARHWALDLTTAVSRLHALTPG
jgi:hypothetical protein